MHRTEERGSCTVTKFKTKAKPTRMMCLVYCLVVKLVQALLHGLEHLSTFLFEPLKFEVKSIVNRQYNMLV